MSYGQLNNSDYKEQWNEASDAGNIQRILGSRQRDAQSGISGAYGNACSVGCVLRADLTALPEDGEWTPAGGFGENASNVLDRQLVQPG